MNVVLNTDEVQTIVALVSANILDHVELADETKRQIRDWRRERDVGTLGLDGFTVKLNEAIGNHIDERTTRMLRKRGKVRVSSRVL
jgi:hypothetical protein